MMVHAFEIHKGSRIFYIVTTMTVDGMETPEAPFADMV